MLTRYTAGCGTGTENAPSASVTPDPTSDPSTVVTESITPSTGILSPSSFW